MILKAIFLVLFFGTLLLVRFPWDILLASVLLVLGICFL